MPEQFYKAMKGALQFRTFFKGRASSPLSCAISAYVFENHLPMAAVAPTARIITEALFAGLDVNKLAVMLQESDPTRTLKYQNEVLAMIEKTLLAQQPRLRRRLAAVAGQ